MVTKRRKHKLGSVRKFNKNWVGGRRFRFKKHTRIRSTATKSRAGPVIYSGLRPKFESRRGWKLASLLPWSRSRRRSLAVKLWSYKNQELFRRASDLKTQAPKNDRIPFIRAVGSIMRRLRDIKKFVAYRRLVRFYRSQLRRRHVLVHTLNKRVGPIDASRAKVQRLRELEVTWRSRLTQRRLACSAIRRQDILRKVVPAQFRASIRPQAVNDVVGGVILAQYIQRVLGFGYQAHYSGFQIADYRGRSVDISNRVLYNDQAISHSVKSQALSQARDNWGAFWSKLRVFRWYFEYRRWRRAYQLSMWFRRLRSYRRLKKEKFYLQLFRLYFYYLGDINEHSVLQMWRRYKRFDVRYQSSGPRFLQMMRMRISNLLVFMGLSTDSISSMEGARLGLARVNGYTKNNPYALVMAGDILQLNLDAAFDYLILFSDIYWLKAEAQSNFVGFMQVTFSMLMFLILRWPRSYELSETDSRLNSRVLRQVIRLFPTHTTDYKRVIKVSRQYDRHQNIVKMMPYKYRQSRREPVVKIK